MKDFVDQARVRRNIHLNGYTIHGWARTRGFSIDTVKNVLYREWGVEPVGKTAGRIIRQLKKEKLL